MKLNVLGSTILILASAACADTAVVTLKTVGASKLTNTVFVDTNETIKKTSCTYGYQFKLPLDDELADKFFQAALAANLNNASLVMTYDPDECVGDGILVQVFEVINPAK